jgi:hypothetical protein
MKKAEPRFDLDLAWGQQGELQIAEFLEWIAKGNGRVEVKRKRYIDLDFYVETHCDKGRTGRYEPSGISISTAHAWAFVIGDTGIAVIVPADELRAALTEPGAVDREERDGNCPTRGKLISLWVLLRRHQKTAPQQVAPVKAPRRAIEPLAATDIRWSS